MTRRRFGWWVAIAGLVSLSGTTSSLAHADERLVCAKASEAGQKLRDDGKLVDARQKFLVCARDACPGVIKKDCADWLTQTEANLPSVVLSAKDGDGADLAMAMVTIDGRTTEEKLDGKAMILDPGPHAFRFETPGEAPIDQRIVVREGEKNRPVAVSWKKAPHPFDPNAEPDWKKKHLPALILGGAGILVLGIGTALVIVDAGDYDDLKNSCGQTKTCTDDQISPVRTKLVLGDIMIGAGVVAVGTAVALWYLESRSPPPTQLGAAPPRSILGTIAKDTKVDFVPANGGGTVFVGGRF